MLVVLEETLAVMRPLVDPEGSAGWEHTYRLLSQVAPLAAQGWNSSEYPESECGSEYGSGCGSE